MKTLSFYIKTFLVVFSLAVPAVSWAKTPVKILSTTDHTARVSWNKTPDAKRYKLVVTNTVTGEAVATYRTKRTRKTVTNLDSAESYKFAVQPKIENDFKAKVYQSVTTLTELDFTPVNALIYDTFEETNLGINATGESKVKYVPGYEGFGLRKMVQYLGDRQLFANVLYYDNANTQLLNPEAGTVEMMVSPQESYQDGMTHNVLDGWTDGRNVNWNINFYYNTGGQPALLVARDYGACTRYRLDASVALEQDKWYKLTFTWRGNESRFYIDDQEIGEFTSETRNVVGGTSIGGRVFVGDEVVAIDNLMITDESPILVRDKAISNDAQSDVACPNFAGVIETDTIQDTYEGIDFHNFPDTATREAMKALIDVLPETYAGETQHIALVEDEDYDAWQSPTAKANYSFFHQTIFLRESLFDTADEVTANAQIIFHEFSHGHNYAKELSYSGPKGGAKRTEWANISGIDAYAGECAVPTDFILTDGFLTAYGSTMPDEDLAEWVGISLNLYRTGSTFSDLLNTNSSKYSALYDAKLSYLKKYGFITEELYNAISATTPNTTYYTQFND